jgi:hypothetical protein
METRVQQLDSSKARSFPFFRSTESGEKTTINRKRESETKEENTSEKIKKKGRITKRREPQHTQ